jgi:hypothetical protein
MMLAVSTATGRKKSIDESSAARTKSPSGDRNTPKIDAKYPRTPGLVQVP